MRARTTWRRALAAAAILLAPGGAGAQAPPGREPGPPLHLFEYEREAPLGAGDSLVRVVEGVQVRSFGFDSPRGGRATGLLLVPPGRGPFAGVLLQHGMPANARYMLPQAIYIARRGAVVLVLDAPFARRRGPPLHFTAADSAEQVQLIVDLQRAADLLLARPDVDPRRLAFVGRSYGGAMGALLAGVERRIRGYALAVADGGLVSHTIGADGARPPPRAIPPEEWRGWLRAMEPIEPIRFVHLAAPAALLFQSARHDRNVSVADAEALQRAAPEPKTVRWYDTGHALDAEAHRDLLGWLHRTVGTSPPRAEDEAGPDFSLRER